MVARAVGYYDSELQGFRGVTQGNPLSPTIFNMVVYMVVRHWFKVMVEVAGGQVGCGQEGRHQNSLLYADDGTISSSDPGWLQGELSTLLGLFDRLGMKTNIRKTFGMVCCPFQAAGTQLEAEYK